MEINWAVEIEVLYCTQAIVNYVWKIKRSTYMLYDYIKGKGDKVQVNLASRNMFKIIFFLHFF